MAADNINTQLSSVNERRWQDWLIVALLFMTFALSNGILYTMGVYQAVWVSDYGLSSAQASLISSIYFAMTCIPSPFISIAIYKLTFRPSVLLILAAPLLTGGVLLNSYGTTFWVLLVANGLLLGPAQSLIDVTTMTAVYHFFVDKHVYLFTSIVSSGLGLGMILVSTLFIFLKPSFGLHGIGILALSFALVVITVSTLLFYPKIGYPLGLVSKHDRLKRRDDYCQVCATNGITAFKKACPCPNNPDNEAERNQKDHCDDDRSLVLASMNTAFSITEEVPAKHVIKSVLANKRFLLILLSYGFSTSIYNTIMYQQPTRLMSIGFSLANGAQCIAANGLVQVIFRSSAGFLTTAFRISPFRLSQLAKLSLGIMTIGSTFLPHLWCQLAYMFLIGICGAFINTTDFLLVKDCMKHGRELGVAMLFLVDGASTLVVDTVAGYGVGVLHTYTIVFQAMGSCAIFGGCVMVLCEILHRRYIKRYDYTVI